MSNIRFLASSVDSLSWLHYDIDFRQARVTDAISWAAIDNDLWLKAMALQGPFHKGGSQGTSQQGGMGSPETRVSGECWSKAKHASLNTPAQNVGDSIREPTVSTVAVVGLPPKPKKLPTPVKVEVLNELLTGYEK